MKTVTAEAVEEGFAESCTAGSGVITRTGGSSAGVTEPAADMPDGSGAAEGVEGPEKEALEAADEETVGLEEARWADDGSAAGLEEASGVAEEAVASEEVPQADTVEAAESKAAEEAALNPAKPALESVGAKEDLTGSAEEPSGAAADPLGATASGAAETVSDTDSDPAEPGNGSCLFFLLNMEYSLSERNKRLKIRKLKIKNTH